MIWWSDNRTQILSGKVKEHILSSYQGISESVGKIVFGNNIKNPKFEIFHKCEFCHQKSLSKFLQKIFINLYFNLNFLRFSFPPNFPNYKITSISPIQEEFKKQLNLHEIRLGEAPGFFTYHSSLLHKHTYFGHARTIL